MNKQLVWIKNVSVEKKKRKERETERQLISSAGAEPPMQCFCNAHTNIILYVCLFYILIYCKYKIQVQEGLVLLLSATRQHRLTFNPDQGLVWPSMTRNVRPWSCEAVQLQLMNLIQRTLCRPAGILECMWEVSKRKLKVRQVNCREREANRVRKKDQLWHLAQTPRPRQSLPAVGGDAIYIANILIWATFN